MLLSFKDRVMSFINFLIRIGPCIFVD